MAQCLKIACVQLCTTDDALANIAQASDLVTRAATQGAQFIALPEAFDFLCAEHEALRQYAVPAADNIALNEMRECARRHGVWIHCGSLTLRDDNGDVVNRSVLLDPEGLVSSIYDKIHMFDANTAELPDSSESSLYRPGDKAVIAEAEGVNFGLTICYDIRFPHLYRALAKAGAAILLAPSAFMKSTGEAHWHALLRARAIENTCFVVAPAQCGHHYGARYSFGHSLIIDPWGRVLQDGGNEPGVILAAIDLDEIAGARSKISSLGHDRAFSVPGEL